MTDPISPTETGFYTVTNAVDVAVSGNFVYVVDKDWLLPIEGGLHILDVSNPTAPLEVGFYPADVSTVAVAGEYAYLSNNYGRMIILVDISNPTAPQEAGGYEVPGNASTGIWVDGNYIYIASYLHGLTVLRQLTDQVSGPIPSAGGSLGSTDGSAEIIFPSGAFSETVNLTYKRLLYDENPGPLAGIGQTFDLSGVISDTGRTAALAPGQTFTIAVSYTDTLKGPAIEESLALYAWDGAAWVKEPTSSVDVEGNLITATPGHLSLWSVLGETRRVYLPMVVH